MSRTGGVWNQKMRRVLGECERFGSGQVIEKEEIEVDSVWLEDM